MTNRDLSEIGIKLIGVYFAASGVVGFTFVIAALVQGPLGGFLDAGFLLFLNVLPLVGRLGVAAICLVWGRRLAARFFEDTQRLTAVPRHDLLIVGLALLGVGLAVGALPGLLRFAVQRIWHVEGPRQAQFPPSMSRQWQDRPRRCSHSWSARLSPRRPAAWLQSSIVNGRRLRRPASAQADRRMERWRPSAEHGPRRVDVEDGRASGGNVSLSHTLPCRAHA